MKIIYSELFKKVIFDKTSFEKLEKILPEKIFLAYTIQYKKFALELKKKLGKKVIGFSQVLGCSKIKPQDTILLLTEGRFHALGLIRYAKTIIIYDGANFTKLGKEDLENMNKENLIKFKNILASDEIGILVSIKYGQFNMKQAEIVKEKLITLGKRPYIFFFDTLNKLELENFGIRNFIIISCPGISYDLKTIIDSETFLELLKK
jgi:diphthamide biosynthesis enzyme Dph1/Dph2-like protein